MKIKPTIILFLLLLNGCQTTEEGVVSNTLLGNPTLPHKEIRSFYSGKQWEEVKSLPYDAYAIFRASVNDDNSVEIRKILSSFPDEERNALAMKFAERANLSPNSIGSHVNPSAKVYVIFYETYSQPNRALVFAKQTGASAASSSVGGTRYLTMWTY